jgi:hypothetical protein
VQSVNMAALLALIPGPDTVTASNALSVPYTIAYGLPFLYHGPRETVPVAARDGAAAALFLELVCALAAINTCTAPFPGAHLDLASAAQAAGVLVRRGGAARGELVAVLAALLGVRLP